MDRIVLKCMLNQVNDNKEEAAKRFLQFLQKDQHHLMKTISYPAEAFTSISWCENKLEMLKGPFNFMLYNKENENELIGLCGAYGNIERERKVVELGYLLAEGFEGKGIVTSTLKFVISKLFSELDALEKLEICSFETNMKSINVAKRLQFKWNENHDKSKKPCEFKGELIHLVVYELTRENFVINQDFYNCSKQSK
ncbi:hypothetical protein ABK040_001105 [Willaertia magna]